MTSLLNRACRWVVARSGLPATWFDHVPAFGSVGNDLSQPFAQSVWVMRAIKKISGPISAVPLKFTLGGEEYTDPALEAFWKSPARGLLLPEFIEASIGWVKLGGESFWLLDDATLRPFPELAQFTPLVVARPDSMREIVEGNQLVGWQYFSGDRTAYRLLPEQVIQNKCWNPYNDWRGLAEYAAASVAAEADFAAGEYARNLMKNNGDTGPIISAKGGMLDDAQQKQIVSQLRQKQEYARRGEFRAAFLTSEVSVENPTAQTTDGNFAAMRLGNRHEIFLAFGVPPSMADKMESYSVGSASDWYLLINETCIPAANALAAQISKVAQKQTGKPLEAFFDWDEHPVMQTVRRERIDAGTKLFDRGIAWRKVSDYLDLGLPEFEGDETAYLPAMLVPADGLGETPEASEDFAEPALPADTNEAPVQEMLRAVRSLRAQARQPECRCGDCALLDLEIRAGDSREAKLWKSLVARRRETMRAYASKFNRVLMWARQQVLARLEDRKNLSRAPGDYLFSLAEFKQRLLLGFRVVGSEALQKAGDQVLKEIGRDDPWKFPPAEAMKFLQTRENKLVDVPEAVFERINDVIQEGMTAGDPLRDIAAAVRSEFNDISEGRAKVIAATETSAAYGTGRHVAMKDAGIEWKKWLTSNNDNVRAAHRQMAGEIKAMDEKWLVVNPDTGETDEILHPGDADGAPWNVINCHCVEIASLEGPEGETE